MCSPLSFEEGHYLFENAVSIHCSSLTICGEGTVWAVGRCALSLSSGCENILPSWVLLPRPPPPWALVTVTNPGSYSAGKCSSTVDRQMEADSFPSDSSAKERVIKQINAELRAWGNHYFHCL